MNKKDLKELIYKEFGETVKIIRFDKKDERLPLADGDSYSWRDYLLENSELRMKHSNTKKISPNVLKKTKLFIEELKKLPEDAILYIWSAQSESKPYSGWACEGKLLLVYNSK